MSESAFFRDAAKEDTKRVVEAVEAVTSAEVVVVIRKAAGHYRHTDYLVGALSALATLVALLFLPWDFPLWSFVVDVIVAFALGALLCGTWPTVRRWLTWPALRRRHASVAAKAAFVDLGISRTSGRSGILVFVAMFERRVEVVTDVGIDVDALGAPFRDVVRALDEAVGLNPDLAKFLAALGRLGPVLSATYPRAADDVNELPDEVAA